MPAMRDGSASQALPTVRRYAGGTESKGVAQRDHFAAQGGGGGVRGEGLPNGPKGGGNDSAAVL
jgi:hypothetical protein